MFEISRAEIVEILDDFGVEAPPFTSGVLGLLRRCSECPVLAVSRPVSVGPVSDDYCEGVAEMPLPWGINYLRERCPDALFLGEDFAAAFVGVWVRSGHLPVAVYDRGRVIEALALLSGAETLDYGLAVDQFESDIGGQYVGEGTPAFLTRYMD